MADAFDVIVIGAGPGGYVAAIRAAQLGMSVACVDKRDAPGGTCLNIGCIPSKALLQSSERFAAAQHDLAAHGVQVAGVTLDLKTMLARKDKVVSDNTRGVEFLFRKNKVEYVKGMARLVKRDRVSVALNCAVPNHLVVIGGGYIGLEMGSVWRRLGSEVTVI